MNHSRFEYGRCSVCNEFGRKATHRCAPKWRVWYEGEKDGPEDVYADSAKDAATKFVEDLDAATSDYTTGKVEVVVSPMTEGEPKQCVVYIVQVEYEPVYTAYRKTDEEDL